MTLGKRSDYGDSKFAGLEVPFPPDLDKAVQVIILLHLSCCLSTWVSTF